MHAAGNIPGVIEILVMDYTDNDSNLRGGPWATATAAVGGSLPVSVPIPSAAVAISGTTSGTITATFCTFGSNSGFTELVTVTTPGKVSSQLTLNVPTERRTAATGGADP